LTWASGFRSTILLKFSRDYKPGLRWILLPRQTTRQRLAKTFEVDAAELLA